MIETGHGEYNEDKAVGSKESVTIPFDLSGIVHKT
jgi:hypothetical protein